MMKQAFLLLFSCLLQTALVCQNATEFRFPNGAKAALCLTYDDGLPSHVNIVAPMLKKYNFKGTFFMTMSATSVREEMEKWKMLAAEGHELANHSAYHPCQKSKQGMDWVKEYYDLDKYTVEEILAEIQFANSFLQAMDGKTSRTFAYPCAHFNAGGVSFKDSVSHYASAARGVHDGLPAPMDIDLFNVPAWAPDNHEAKNLIAYIETIIEKQTLSTICFHGVGGEHLRVSAEAHEEMLKWLDAHRDKIWVTTFQEATDYLKRKKGN